MKPIYQMMFEPSEDNSFGLLFSEESEDFNQPVFVLPIKNDDHWLSDSYYLPGEIKGRYTEFELNFNNGVFVINDKRLNHTIRFGVGYDNLFYSLHPLDRHLFFGEATLKYLGKHKEIVYPFDRFIPLSPLDLIIMDFCYKELQACFVGLTPVFGERRIYEQ